VMNDGTAPAWSRLVALVFSLRVPVNVAAFLGASRRLAHVVQTGDVIGPLTLASGTVVVVRVIDVMVGVPPHLTWILVAESVVCVFVSMVASATLGVIPFKPAKDLERETGGSTKVGKNRGMGT
jgi:hypothetical protein